MNYVRLFENFQSISVKKTGESNLMDIFKIYLNDDIIGQYMISLENNDREMWVVGLEIYEKYRGNGYSQKVLDIIKKYAIDNGCESLCLNVHKENGVAINSYKKFGFVEFRETEFHCYMKLCLI